MDDLRERLCAAELRYWDNVKRTQRTGSLGEILAAESRALGLDVTSAVVSEAAQRHLDAWTPHIQHHPDAKDTLRTLRSGSISATSRKSKSANWVYPSNSSPHWRR